jgi:hypothetical protein
MRTRHAAAAALLAVLALALMPGRAAETSETTAGPAEEGAALTRALPEPWRLDRALGSPGWLHLSLTQRTRLEGLRNQFRPVFPGSERGLALRTTFLTELRFAPVTLGLELADMRLYLAHEDAPLNSTLINPLDILQLYAGARFVDAFAEGASLSLRAGRQTLDLGSRRLLARNRFRNTINAFTGLDLLWTGARGRTARGFLTVPVGRRPNVVDALEGNDRQSDEERWRTLLWGFHHDTPFAAGSLQAEIYLLGLHEEDEPDWLTRDRDLLTPGLRLTRPPAPGRFDFEVELIYQAGTSRATRLPQDTRDLRHRAYFLHGSLARTFDSPWRPRLMLLYDHASGDRDPFDERFERFDTLFGARRFELGPTGLYGALARANIRTPGLRLDVYPHARVRALVAWRPAWLASARDFWIPTAIRDVTGGSGSFIGHQLEGAVRWEVLPANVRLEGGLAWLRLGEFPTSAPGGLEEGENPLYVYLQVSFQI